MLQPHLLHFSNAEALKSTLARCDQRVYGGTLKRRVISASAAHIFLIGSSCECQWLMQAGAVVEGKVVSGRGCVDGVFAMVGFGVGLVGSRGFVCREIHFNYKNLLSLI